MAKLEELKPGCAVRGVRHGESVDVIDVKWHGVDVVELTFRTQAGKPDSELLFRDPEPQLEVVGAGRRWSYEGDGELFRLVSEARRIELAHLFDPHLAVSTSRVTPRSPTRSRLSTGSSYVASRCATSWLTSSSGRMSSTRSSGSDSTSSRTTRSRRPAPATGSASIRSRSPGWTSCPGTRMCRPGATAETSASATTRQSAARRAASHTSHRSRAIRTAVNPPRVPARGRRSPSPSR